MSNEQYSPHLSYCQYVLEPDIFHLVALMVMLCSQVLKVWFYWTLRCVYA